ncbi:response regulator [Alkalilimnicola sp. S0819]|uniref:response regulator n=1 Tax=Alkalilimnicola sp. S0819 TaxID=2613922 RepID=UPI0012613CC2|nr:response regulator [Alkalilimnicola sp. S0819]KAB7627586.1 response regulator [Alkalilimnicola sp. S0819]MPQ15747.1 response regulator [Alkalilimnicola sp. S0819]
MERRTHQPEACPGSRAFYRAAMEGEPLSRRVALLSEWADARYPHLAILLRETGESVSQSPLALSGPELRGAALSQALALSTQPAQGLVELERGGALAGVGWRMYRTARISLARDGSAVYCLVLGREGADDAIGEALDALCFAFELAARLAAADGQTDDLARKREMFLGQFNDALRGCHEPRRIMAIAADRLGRNLRVARAGYVEFDLPGRRVASMADYSAGEATMVGRWDLDQTISPSLLHQLQAGQTVVVEDTQTDPDCAELAQVYREFGTRAAVIVPLVKNGRLVAGFVVQHGRARRWSSEEIALVQAVAERTWLAVVNERTREALLASERKYKTLVDHAPEAIAVLDVDTLCLVEANDKALEMFGIPREEMPYTAWGELLPDHDLDGNDSRGKMRELADRALAGELVVEEALRRNAAGEEFVVEIRTTALPDPAGRRLVRTTFTDITKRKQAERALAALNETLERRVLERTREAEQRAAQLRVLAAQLANAEQRERRRIAEVLHDHLQQLLVAAKLRVSYLQNRVVEAWSGPVFHELSELIDESLDASRSLTVELSPPILYDAGLVAALDWLARWSLDKNGLRVTVRAGEEIDPLPEDLRAFLFQAVRELLFNVVKHGRISEAEIELERDAEQQLWIGIRDHGRGFDAAEAVRYQGSGGFGLFSIRERIEVLGGQFILETAPGEGTTVRLSLPVSALPPTERRQPVPSAEASSAQLRIPLDRIRVLLADDHEMLREGLAKVLGETPDIELVGKAADGLEAVRLADRLKPDVVIMDVGMPRLNGIEATRRICIRHPQTRVIGLSMHDQRDMEGAMLAAGAQSYLTKGGSTEELLGEIRNQQP